MKRTFKKGISILLAICIMTAVSVVAFASDNDKTVSLSISSANVAGLPIPAAFNENNKVVLNATRLIGGILNDSGADIICTQEDFQYHSVLAKQMTNYKYQTYTSGGIPVGDGLNIFSKYPIYNVDRVTWEEFNGILDAGNDGLTPKGFLKFTVDVGGILIDVYDIHVDAYGSVEDQLVKCKQFKQLNSYIIENSQDRPVMITGDYNATFHTDEYAELYETLIVGAGFKDTWVNTKNDGNYFRGENSQDEINSWLEKYNNCYWGLWDSVERVLYRDGNGVGVEAKSIEYKECKDDEFGYLSDHNIMTAVVELTASDYSRPAIELNEPEKPLAIYRFSHGTAMVFRCIWLLVSEIVTKLFSGELF